MEHSDLFGIPYQPGTRVSWSYLKAVSPGIVLSKILQHLDQPMLVIAANSMLASSLVSELNFFKHQSCQILQFPDWETLPYDNLSPHADLISERLTTLKNIRCISTGVVVTTINTMMQRLMPAQFLDKFSLILRKHENLNLNLWRTQLIDAGYRAVQEVHEHGEFAIRGSIVDIFPMGSRVPYRLDLCDQEIDSIRIFSPDTQLSLQEISHVELLPAKEFPVDADAIEYFQCSFRKRFTGNPLQFPIYQDISQGITPPGIEYYLPLFTNSTTSLYSYLPSNTLLVCVGDIKNAANNFWQEIEHRYQELCHDITRPFLKPQEIFFSPDAILKETNNYACIDLQASRGSHPVNVISSPKFLIDQYKHNSHHEIIDNLAKIAGRILFSVTSSGRRELVLNFLQYATIKPVFYSSWKDFIADDALYGITISPLTIGFCLVDEAITLLTEYELFNKIEATAVEPKKNTVDLDAVVRNLTHLNLGDPVVHIQYGIARYQGLHILTTGNAVGEFLCLEYLHDDKLYVPVSSLALVSRYSGGDPRSAPINSLKNDHWHKTKNKVSSQIRDVAAELLNIYSKRAVQTKIPIQVPHEDYAKFVADFSFTETKDQQQAIDAVIYDMTSNQAMDRVICGDVGFGKTEVAMRAAFLAVQNNLQVAILVPTTLLAQQHYQTLQDRFADWPIKIGVLTRGTTQLVQQKLREEVCQGKIDVLIGTHKILQKTLKFKQLGLVIVDEEHLFGVHQKEYLKSIRANVDILTLTATPIPRTLNMSLSGIRDLSIIATPPAKRLATKTFVEEYQPTKIQEAVQRELLRGGQVFFVHNEVSSIAKVAQDLEKLLPESRIAVAHGQMKSKDLEKIMTAFYYRHYNVLVCTTIIESGLDIPTANTIIINNADNFGLAQLYQLRGRVGRSHHQAYAYLLIASRQLLTPEAQKRLEAISAAKTLGSGFNLATHDLEIRGAGALLGDQQSGNIHAVGFNLYNELLSRAIEELKAGKEITNIDWEAGLDIVIELQLNALIPETYIHDVTLRLQFYKRIASATTVQNLDDIQVELIDRFGLLPEPLKNLFGQSELKLIMLKIGATKLTYYNMSVTLEFGDSPVINSEKLIKLIQENPKNYQLINGKKIKYNLPEHSISERLALIMRWISEVIF